MTTKTRPLTASLHTVTAVSRVASSAAVAATFSHSVDRRHAADLTIRALEILGYQAEAEQVRASIYAGSESALPPLLAACLAAVRKAVEL